MHETLIKLDHWSYLANTAPRSPDVPLSRWHTVGRRTILSEQERPPRCQQPPKEWQSHIRHDQWSLALKLAPHSYEECFAVLQRIALDSPARVKTEGIFWQVANGFGWISDEKSFEIHPCLSVSYLKSPALVTANPLQFFVYPDERVGRITIATDHVAEVFELLYKQITENTRSLQEWLVAAEQMLLKHELGHRGLSGWDIFTSRLQNTIGECHLYTGSSITEPLRRSWTRIKAGSGDTYDLSFQFGDLIANLNWIDAVDSGELEKTALQSLLNCIVPRSDTPRPPRGNTAMLWALSEKGSTEQVCDDLLDLFRRALESPDVLASHMQGFEQSYSRRLEHLAR